MIEKIPVLCRFTSCTIPTLTKADLFALSRFCLSQMSCTWNHPAGSVFRLASLT